jgi:hypothetical protein
MSVTVKLPFVEEQGTFHGLRYAVVVTILGHRCGYVAVPDSHPWHGLAYNSRADGAPHSEDPDDYFDQLDEHIEAKIGVHGGLTYSGTLKGIEGLEPGWWFGFDCAHAGDLPDPAFAVAPTYRIFDGGTVCTLDYVRSECEILAKQLAEVSA